MTVYMMPGNEYNIWTGRRGGGGGGILDLVGQALIQPMLQRDALARTYKYNERLANQQQQNALELQRADEAYKDRQINEAAYALSQNPNIAQGISAFLPRAGVLGFKANLADVLPFVQSTPLTVDQGDAVTVQSYNPNGTFGEGMTFKKSLSPKEKADIQIAANDNATRAKIAGMRQPQVYGGGGRGGAGYAPAGAGAFERLLAIAKVYNDFKNSGGKSGGFQWSPIDGGETAGGGYAGIAGGMLDLALLEAIKEAYPEVFRDVNAGGNPPVVPETQDADGKDARSGAQTQGDSYRRRLVYPRQIEGYDELIKRGLSPEAAYASVINSGFGVPDEEAGLSRVPPPVVISAK